MHWQRLAMVNRPRLLPTTVALSAALAVTAALLAVPAAAQDSTPSSVSVVDPAASVTFTGSGWGHGVGMGQWGARARSDAGHSAEEILAFYYQGTRLVENYGHAEPTPDPTPTTPTAPASLPAGTPTSPADNARVRLATAQTTTLTPDGLNRISIDNQNIPVGGQDAARAPAGTPITFTRDATGWHITYGGTDICPEGCAGQTAQLHFATDTAVAVSTTGRSYSHGRINLIAVDGEPDRFHITLDSLTVEKFLDDPAVEPVVAGPASTDPDTAPTDPGDVAVVLAAAGATTLTPEGLNRVSIDDADISYRGQSPVRAPHGTPITVARVEGRWRIAFAGNDVCGNGCAGDTAQIHFGTDTAVAVSTTGRSYSHGRINLIAVPGDPGRFLIVLDSLTIAKFFGDPHSALLALPADDPATTPVEVTQPTTGTTNPEDTIRIHLSTTSSTTLTPPGIHRITVDGQGDIQVGAGTPVTITNHAGHWHIVANGVDRCGTGCVGRTAQLHFATGTSVSVSNTGRSYSHGRINLVPAGGEPGQFYVILDSLSMENYLRGIAETPMNWGLAVHEAQAIAARSYATATLRERRASSSWNRPFDLYSNVWDQAFVGDTRERHPDAATWLRAVENTAGQVLYHNDAAIRAFYSASNGGYTERSGYVFATDLPYLMALPDPFDAQSPNPYRSWTRTYSVADLNQWLNDHADTAVGRLISMEVVGGVGQSGRLDKAQIEITGTTRTVTVSGSRLQSRINTAARESGNDALLSTRFTFDVPPATVAVGSPPPADPTDPDDTTPPTEVVPADQTFYSGVIDGPDFCLNHSLGGPVTHAFDSDGDGVADLCSLPRTRREAVAHQRTLEELALVKQEIFIARFAEECRSVADSFGEPDQEAGDECQQYRDLPTSTPAEVTSPSGSTDEGRQPATGQEPDQYAEDDPAFYSGTINSPDFCLNHSLGGAITFAFDSDGDGVADICALPRTRRAAVARQRALDHMSEASEDLEVLYEALFLLNCLNGPSTLGEPEQEAVDACQRHIASAMA